MISFFVSGTPRSTQTGSVIHAGGRTFPVRRNTGWSAVCGLVARQYAPPRPLDGPLRVTLHFQLPAPKTWKAGAPGKRPDLENLCKGLLDSWNGVLWHDDAQVTTLILEKRYSLDNPGVHVEVEGDR